MMMVKVSDITKTFSGRRASGSLATGNRRRALDGVSLEIASGESFGIVGESGSGKTTLAKIILGSLRPDSGEVVVTTKRVAVVPQDPHGSLDPKMRAFDILAEGLILKRENPSSIGSKVRDALRLVKLPDTALTKFPHQFSGGERQRIAIARAIVTGPELIVCDEPVSSLDVTIQLDILRLLREIRERKRLTYIFISHDLRAIKFMCGRTAVMKDGRIVETGIFKDIYESPSHEYTRLLISSVPEIFGAENK